MKNTDRISVTTPKAVDPIQGPMPKGIRRIPGSTMKDGDPIPVAIYARVSSDRQDIHNSIEAQIDECTRYAKDQQHGHCGDLHRRGRQRENQLSAGIPRDGRGWHQP